MSGRDASVVTTGAVGLIVAMIGLAGLSFTAVSYAAMRQNAADLAIYLDESPELPVGWAIVYFAAYFLAILLLGVGISLGRERLATYWVSPRNIAAQGPESAPEIGSTAVGIVGLVFAMSGLGRVVFVGVTGVIHGWSFESLGNLWYAATILLAGVVLVMRPGWVSRLWKADATKAVG